jgi:uncharacterized Ntn-hydrolase superfamily protein
MRQGTYSIVARDPESGAFGVAVQSHWFGVGSVVPWAEAGTGAVATQSVAEPAYGPSLLKRLAAGENADEALPALLDEDPLAEVRQVGVVDASGGVAVHTGADCIPSAGHATGAGFACQANMMLRPGVPEAMAEAYTNAAGPLAERLLAALEGAERAGGDVRGRQSAALVVTEPAGESWRREVDLHVEDHADPVTELARILRFARAYARAGEADELAAAERHADAAAAYLEASGIAPESDELLFWAGLGAAAAGDTEGGLERVRRAIAVSDRWAELLDRLDAGMAPGAPVVRELLNGA